jgi:hypothetical protein
MAETAAKCEPADTGCADDAARRRHAERVRSVIEVSPCGTASGAGRLVPRIDADATHPRQVNHNTVVACLGAPLRPAAALPRAIAPGEAMHRSRRNVAT